MGGEIKFLGDMEKLTLSEGDVLVVSVEQPISAEVSGRLRSDVVCVTGHSRVLVLSGDISVGVLEKANIFSKNT